MKIAIGTCEKLNGVCTTKGCFSAFNKKEKNFASYKGKDVELASFFTCQICSSNSTEWMNKVADKLKDEDVSVLHLSVCVAKCKADKDEEIANIFRDRNIQIVKGTH